jgi:tetratricopeptide (TPR) repeat protein
MDFPRAMADENKAIELDPSLARAYRVRGALLSKERDHDRALADLSKAIELDPTFAVGYFERALAYAAKGGTGAAIEDLETALTRGLFGMMPRLTPDNLEKISPLLAKAIERNDKDAIAYAGRGGIYRVTGLQEQAIVDYSRAIERDRRLVEAYIGRGVSYFKLRADDPRALADFNKALSSIQNTQAPTCCARLFYIGGVFQTSGRRRTDALADFTKAVELDPDFGPAYANRYFLRSSSGEKTAAQGDMLRAMQLDSMLVAKMQPWPSFLGNVNVGGLPVPR